MLGPAFGPRESPRHVSRQPSSCRQVVNPLHLGARQDTAKISLTAAQKRLIRTSFLKLAPALDLVGQLYFLKLFRLDPEFRARFGADPERHGRKFMAAVKLGVISLNHDDGLAPIIKLLGIRYRQMGLKVRDYRTMAKALMWTFERSLERSSRPRPRTPGTCCSPRSRAC